MKQAELLYFSGSPFARMARILSLEWELPVVHTELSFPPVSSLFDRNPLGQVPVLILPGSHYFFPTLIVLEKLWHMANCPDHGFNPDRDRQTLLTVLQSGDALVSSLYQEWAGLGPVKENRVGYDPAARHMERFERVLDWSEALLDDGKIPCVISLVSVALASLVLWAEARNGPEWRYRPKLARLVGKLEHRPSFQATSPQPWTP